MMRSLFSGVSGLKTHQTKMDVIGNNISNVNTVAFKSSSTTFSDLMYQTTSQASGATATRGGTNAKQIGLGVTNGATKISITSSGAAQSTGDALDIRLTDTNTTNFFVVSNGSEEVYTRAGSFYVDANGNLAMTTTGYLVMGWGVNQETMTINKTTELTNLKVMANANKTSTPEATTKATVSGVIDKNDSNVTSESGYVRSLTFYDSEGYSYTAKFSIKRVGDGTDGLYTIELTNVYNSDDPAVDILNTNYLGNNANNALSDIFGETINVERQYTLSDKVTWNGTNYVYTGTDGNSYNLSKDADGNVTLTLSSDATVVYSLADLLADPTNTLGVTYQSLFGMSDSDAANATGFDFTNYDFTTDSSNNSVTVNVQTVGYYIQFNTKDGTLSYVGNADDTGETLTLNSQLLGPSALGAALSNITMDFGDLLNYDNGGTSTVSMEKGDEDGNGAGKKLGNMTGISVQSDGKIYGSYDNGNTVLLGQIAVAQFANASGLEELGNNTYGTTLNSGDAEYKDVSEDGSSMSTGQLEMSNVDLSSEFTDMITTQRGFQANSRIITVSDTLLEELINLKR